MEASTQGRGGTAEVSHVRKVAESLLLILVCARNTI